SSKPNERKQVAICHVDFRVARASLAITSSAPATRRTEGYGRSGYVRGSVRPDARELHHLGPFLNVLGDELAELDGRTCKRRVAKVCNPRFHRGIGENSIDLLVEFLDYIGGRILWRADTQPRARIIARQKIVQ